MDDRLLHSIHEDLKLGFARIHERLDVLNGRVREAELAIAAVKGGLLVLSLLATVLGIWQYVQ